MIVLLANVCKKARTKHEFRKPCGQVVKICGDLTKQQFNAVDHRDDTELTVTIVETDRIF